MQSQSDMYLYFFAKKLKLNFWKFHDFQALSGWGGWSCAIDLLKFYISILLVQSVKMSRQFVLLLFFWVVNTDLSALHLFSPPNHVTLWITLFTC